MTLVKDRILKKFEDEIHQLDRELKTELPKEIKRARELGDLRENAEYQAAKERQRLVEARISLLQKRVSEISLMNLDQIPHDKVGFGSTVTLREEAGHNVVYQLVMPEDANVDAGSDLDRLADRPRAAQQGRGDDVDRQDPERRRAALRGHQARDHPRRMRPSSAL